MALKVTALIMAGGRGERFWPKSRKDNPKQFLSLTGSGKTMIQLTVERIQNIIDIEDIFVVTGKEYKKIVQDQLPKLPSENIICEPMGKNTAPCIGLGAAYIKRKYEDALMVVLPSDHLIKYHNIFERVLLQGMEIAKENKNIVTLGITPDYPETGYGYIKFNPKETYQTAYKVDCFVEKPDLQKAKAYLVTEEYLWNSGMFLWKISTIWDNIQKFLPDLAKRLGIIQCAFGTEEEAEILEKEFAQISGISVDYGIMEKAQDIYTIPCSFGWDDVGSWPAVSRINQKDERGNVINGNVITIDTDNSIVEGTGKLIATVGIDDLIVIDTEDAMLICDKSSANDIKKVIDNLKSRNLDQYI